MEFNDLQKKIIANAQDYGERYNVIIDKDFVLLKLVEEIGEFAEAILTQEKKSRPEKLLPPDQSAKKVAQELADVVGMAIVAADVMGVDLERALHDKWIKEIPST
ncbi:MAG: phosphoribosyl-ATP pyrophosphohydrolase [Candidatus Andersenbacteria bacterium]|nr:phosphoribosyl-ATP pyrophosphohydrolase [Candidatus Andersenbacteria bacterium]